MEAMFTDIASHVGQVDRIIAFDCVLNRIDAEQRQIGRAVSELYGRDRKSGSAGMPRPISYAVFCLKKKKAYMCRLRLVMRVGQIGIGLCQAAQRIFQFDGPVAHHRFQRDRGFEHRKSIAGHVARPFDPVDQGGVDLAQLAHLLPQAVQLAVTFDRGERDVRHRPMASPLKVWLTCSA
eukprot:TRINITY_DN19812_c0_g1_i2.p2 TRINITY_DN19812_c0_g1~~TRINITY_DN19812_c0_g1_i2.p2  ORF type:complete len:179 (+),score=38.35 TRINITY_DN19812_c0_g1_i2:298-834(+)